MIISLCSSRRGRKNGRILERRGRGNAEEGNVKGTSPPPLPLEGSIVCMGDHTLSC